MKRQFFTSFIVSMVLILLMLPQGLQAKEETFARLDCSYYTPPPEGTSFLPLPDGKIKNIILMIGDGMGFNVLYSTKIVSVGVSGNMYIDLLTATGMMTVHSIDELITDSAAAATAMATGKKTKNRIVSMSENGEIFETILEKAEKRGMVTGLVSTSSITHATPACFASHVESRYMENEIAEQIATAGIEVILGGGTQFFTPSNMDGSKRKDSRNLIEEMQETGYTFVGDRDALINSSSNKLLGLFSSGGMKTQPPEPSIAEMTEKSLQVLSKSEQGFFLMIEGSQIDWEAHDNDFEDMVRQTLLFDEAVGVALDFAMEDGETFIIVTTDHDTGGLVITGGGQDGGNITVSWASTHHTASRVPVFGYGPGAETSIPYIKDNTDVARIIEKLLDF
ncbi:alkaline phosphatase [bacterium]|nr:alkaline phosphatase [bacterium]